LVTEVGAEGFGHMAEFQLPQLGGGCFVEHQSRPLPK
jgi:hypothetical protein